MRVATFNVHHCEGRDGTVDVARVADALRAARAEVVALQELDMGMDRTGFTNQPGEIAAATGLTVEFHPVLQRGDGRYGSALAATKRLDSAKIALPSVGREEPRAAVVGRYEGITFVGAHLSRSRRARVQQIRALAVLARRLEPPVVLMGDLNELARGLAPLFEAGFRGAPHPFWREVWLRSKPSRAIDHILAGPGLRIELQQTIRTVASDHPLLVAEVARVD